MYLRTTKRTNRDGSVVSYYQLAHNVWDSEKKQAKAQVVYNFGRADQLDDDDLARLCKSIARVCGLQVTDPLLTAEEPSEHQDVIPRDVKQIITRPYGAVLAISSLWEELGIGARLRELQRRDKCKVPYERALFLMTANRLCEPSSKLGTWERWLQKVHLPECDDLKLNHMYEAMDLLRRHASEVEEALFFEVADLLNLEVDVVFYDTTTCRFSIDYADEEGDGSEEDGGDEEDGGIRFFGRPKEGGWSPQVIVALAVTREGIPVRSWVFPGNTADVSTVQQVKQDLRGWKLGRAMFVGDAGMDSLDNRRELARGAGKYLLAVRSGSLKEVRDDVLTRPGRYKEVSDNLRAKEVSVGEGELRRRYIVCFNPKQAEREERHREQLLQLLREELDSHPDLDATRKWAIKLQASRRFGRFLKVDKRGKLRIDRAAVKRASRMDGKWVLITNDDTLSLEDAATGYRNQLVIERCFRSMKKTRIRMEPVHHRLARRIEAHIKICVLALLLQRVAELRCGVTWPRLCERLDQLQVTQYQTKSHLFFRRNEISKSLGKTIEQLGIKRPGVILDVQKRA